MAGGWVDASLPDLSKPSLGGRGPRRPQVSLRAGRGTHALPRARTSAGGVERTGRVRNSRASDPERLPAGRPADVVRPRAPDTGRTYGSGALTHFLGRKTVNRTARSHARWVGLRIRRACPT